MTARVLVVGGGVIGLSVAYRLLRRGAQVRVLQADRPNASLAAAGMLPPALEALDAPDAHPDLHALLAAAAARWRVFAEEIGGGEAGATLGYRVIGTLTTEVSPGDRVATLAESARAIGACVERLDGAAARKLEPGLAEGVTRALYFPDDALVEPPLLMAALVDALKRGGAAVVSGRAAALEPKPSGVSVRLADGGLEEADAVVLSTGWSGAPFLAPELSALFPVKGQIMTVASGGVAPAHMVRGEGVYLAPRGDGRVEIGATSERGRDDVAIEAQAIINLKARAGALFPAMKQAFAVSARAGVRPGSPDHAPLLGASRISDKVFIGAGTYRNGVLLAPLISDALGDAILGGADSTSALWLKRFAAQRFAP